MPGEVDAEERLMLAKFQSIVIGKMHETFPDIQIRSEFVDHPQSLVSVVRLTARFGDELLEYTIPWGLYGYRQSRMAIEDVALFSAEAAVERFLTTIREQGLEVQVGRIVNANRNSGFRRKPPFPGIPNNLDVSGP